MAKKPAESDAPRKNAPRWREPELIQAIADEVASGVSDYIAGQLHGLAGSTVGIWLSRAESAIGPGGEIDPDHAEFVEAVAPIARARASFFAESERMAAEGHAGRMWLLPRRLQSLYGQRSEVAVSSPDAGVGKLLERLTGNGTS